MASEMGAIVDKVSTDKKKGGILTSFLAPVLCCGKGGAGSSKYAKVPELEALKEEEMAEVIAPGQCSLKRLNFNFWFWYYGPWKYVFLTLCPKSSVCSGIPSYVLRAVRVFQAAAMVGVLIWSLSVTQNICRWHIFLTHWTLLIVVAYLVCAAVMMFIADPSEKIAPTIVRVVWVLQTLALPGSIVVVFLFWGLLAPTLESIQLLDYFTHGYVAIAMLIDFVLSKQPYYSLHAVYYLLFGFSYIMFTLLLFVNAGCLSDANCDVDGNGNPYVYSVLDWRDPQAAATVTLGSLVAATIICQLLFLMSKGLGAEMGFM